MRAKLSNLTLGKVQQRNSSSGLIRLAILFHETMKAEGMVIVILVPCVRRTRSQQQYYYYGLVVRRSKKRALNLSKKFHQKPLLKAKRRRERERGGNEQKQKCSKKTGIRGEELGVYNINSHTSMLQFQLGMNPIFQFLTIIRLQIFLLILPIFL